MECALGICILYSYINIRKAHKTLDGDVALNTRTVTPPVCTIPDTDNHNQKWHTAIRNMYFIDFITVKTQQILAILGCKIAAY